MKKLLVFAVLASFSIITTAQEEKIRFGAKAGLNVANISGDEIIGLNSKSRTGFHIGAVVEIPLSDKFAFAPELLYSSQGSKEEANFDLFGFSITGESTIKLDYLNIPLMVKYYVAQGFSIQAGPQVGFLLSANEEGNSNQNGVVTEFDTDVKDIYKGIDFGLNLGLGYQLDMGLFFDARYNLGLADINDIDFEIGGLEFKNKNDVVQLSVGYKF